MSSSRSAGGTLDLLISSRSAGGTLDPLIRSEAEVENQ
jgi:hypothetical protein